MFAPGVENYVAMGAVESLWEGDLAQHLLQALRTPAEGDLRAARGAHRGGRALAAGVSSAVAHGDA